MRTKKKVTKKSVNKKLTKPRKPSSKKTVKKKVSKPKKVKTPLIIKSGVLCNGCGNDIPQQRIDYFLKIGKHVTVCVNCSDVKTKKPIIINHGSGDDICQETLIVDDETYSKYKKLEEATNRHFGIKTQNMFDEETPKDNLGNIK